MIPENVFEQLYFAAVRLVLPIPGMPDRASIGTGFLLAGKIDANTGAVFLFSNRHVLGAGPDVRFLMTRKRPDGRADLGNVVEVNVGGLNEVVNHPDPNIDLACFNVSPIVSNPDLFVKWFTNIELEEFSLRTVVPGSTVYFAGYPSEQYDRVHNLPLLRTGTVASIPSIDFDGQPVFAIDATVVGGSSGSAVVGVVGGRAKLLGVIAQRMLGRAGIDLGQPIHIGLVVRAERVAELLAFALERVRALGPTLAPPLPINA